MLIKCNYSSHRRVVLSVLIFMAALALFSVPLQATDDTGEPCLKKQKTSPVTAVATASPEQEFKLKRKTFTDILCSLAIGSPNDSARDVFPVPTSPENIINGGRW